MSMLKLRSNGNATKKSRLAIEQLEDRVVPTITFMQYSNGTFAYNSDSHQFRQLTTAQAKTMDEGADGTLFASYNSGTFRYDYASNAWTKLTTAQSTELSAANDNTLFASYSSGTWEYDTGGWHKITASVATQLAAVGDNSFYGDYSTGTWKFKDSAWTKITGARTTGAMDASQGGTLFVSYSSGTWRYRANTGSAGAPAGWTKMTTAVASDIAAVNSWQFYATYASGTWRADDNTWTKLSSAKATSIRADSTSFVGNFSDGTWEYKGGWTNITKVNVGQIRITNDYAGAVAIKLYHPQNPNVVFKTWNLASQQSAFLAMNGQRINIGSDWGIQIVFGNGVKSQVRKVGEIASFTNNVHQVTATAIFKGKGGVAVDPPSKGTKLPALNTGIIERYRGEGITSYGEARLVGTTLEMAIWGENRSINIRYRHGIQVWALDANGQKIEGLGWELTSETEPNSTSIQTLRTFELSGKDLSNVRGWIVYVAGEVDHRYGL